MDYIFAIAFLSMWTLAVRPDRSLAFIRLANGNERAVLRTDIQRMKDNMLEDVDVCSDFVGYVCGQNKLLADSYLWEYKQPKDVFDSQSFLTRIEQKAKDFYYSCINHQTIGNLRATHLYQALGGMPILEGVGNYSVEGIEAAFGRLGFPAFIDHRVFAKGTADEYVVIYPESRMYIELYPEFFKKFMLKNGVDAERVLREYEFIKKFYRTALETEHLVALSDLRISYRELKELFPNYQWDVYFNFTLKDSMPVRVFRKELLTNLLKLAKENTQAAVNYMWTLFLKDIGEDCHHPLIQFFDPYRKLIDRPTYDTFKVLMILRYLENSYDNVIRPLEWITDDMNRKIKEAFKQCNQWVLHYDPGSEEKFGDIEIIQTDFYKNFFKVFERAGAENVRNRKSKVSEPEVIFNGFFKKGFYNDSFPMALNFGRFGQGVIELILNQSTRTGFLWEHSNSEEKYNQLLQCFDLFESDSVDELISTQAVERLTHNAFKSWEKDNEDSANAERELLVEHGFDAEQAFIVGSLAIKCPKKLNEYWKIVQNSFYKHSQIFATSFKCPSEAPMRSKERCSAW